jgi:aquaporin Z
MRKLAAESIGTFALVFAGTGALTINDVTHGAVTHVGIALTFGLVVMAMIYAVGDVSGAHLNPAVTIAFWVAGRFEGNRIAPYVVSQLAGALAASVCLRFLFWDHSTHLGATLPSGPWLQSFVLEFLLTALLMFVILGVSTGSKENGVMAGAAVGAVVAFEALFAGPICGASMNPARSLGPALVSGHIEYLWIYLASPILGAAFAVVGWRCVRPEAASIGVVSETVPEGVRRKKVLFVCVENSNRSQMAEAFARIEGGTGVEAQSAGSRPSGRVNPKAVEAMRELGYDLAVHRSKSLSELSNVEFDAVVTMGCGDACPNIPAKRREDWQIPCPKEMPVQEFRQVRDLIREKVKALLNDL